VPSLKRFTSSAGLVAAGAVLGIVLSQPIGSSTAQAPPVAAAAESAGPAVDISEANGEKIKQASDALGTAQAALVQDVLYKPAVGGLNAYAVLAGGVDALADLESGRGVDPITFAGLHTGLAVDEVTPHLAFDANGRLTYKGKLVRMYPADRMRAMTQRQADILTLTAGTRRAGARGAEAE